MGTRILSEGPAWQDGGGQCAAGRRASERIVHLSSVGAQVLDSVSVPPRSVGVTSREKIQTSSRRSRRPAMRSVGPEGRASVGGTPSRSFQEFSFPLRKFAERLVACMVRLGRIGDPLAFIISRRCKAGSGFYWHRMRLPGQPFRRRPSPLPNTR
jgi:hypothetical protein